MASPDETSWVERHIEKAVLGATTILLVVVLLFWVIPSPQKVSLSGSARVGTGPEEAFSPAEVDEALLRRRDGLQARLRQLDRTLADAPNMTPEQRKQLVEKGLIPDLDPPDYPTLLARQFGSPYAGTVRDLVQFTPGRTGQEKVAVAAASGEQVSLAQLLPLPAPEAPMVNIAHEVIAVPKGGVQGGFDYKETFTAHAASVFPHGKLSEKWTQALDKVGIAPSLVFYAVRADRRQRSPGGQWSQPESVSFVRVNQDPLAQLPTESDGSDLENLRAAIAVLAELQNQMRILEPEYHSVFGPDGRWWQWLRNKPRTKVSDLLAQSDQPAQPIAPVRPVVSTRRPTPTPRPRMPSRMPKGTPPLPPGIFTPDPESPGGASRGPGRDPRLPPGVFAPDPESAARPVRTPAPSRTTPRTPAPPMPTVPAPDAGTPEAAVPPLDLQLASTEGILEAWFHEMHLVPRMEYSYRIQLVLVSPVMGMLQKLVKPEDANVVLLATPWSPWSKPASAQPLTQFFVVGGSQFQNIVVVEVFTKRWGQTLRTRLTLNRGQPIKGATTASVVLPNGQTEVTEVSFDTGAVAVDFNFNLKRRLAGTEHVGTTTELVYLDADGKLRTRTEAADRASKLYTELDKEVTASAVGREPPQ